MLGTILALLFAAMPSLKAQTNQSVETNPSNAVAVANSSAADTNQLQTNQAVRANNSGIHVGGREPVDINWGKNSSGVFGPLGFGKTLVAVLTAFVLPVAVVVVLPVAIVGLVFYTIHRRNKLAHETLRLMIEKGTPITPEIIANLNIREKKKDGNPQIRYLLPGLILAGVGIGVLAVAGKPGLIVLLIGLAFLIVWLVERKSKTNAPPPEA